MTGRPGAWPRADQKPSSKLVAAVPDVGEALAVEAGGIAPIGGMQIVQVGAREADAIAQPLKGPVQDRVDDGADGEAGGLNGMGMRFDVAEAVGVGAELEESELGEAQAHGGGNLGRARRTGRGVGRASSSGRVGAAEDGLGGLAVGSEG